MFGTFIGMTIQRQRFTEKKLSIKINEPHSCQYLGKQLLNRKTKQKYF
jgi:hypothetical protein